MLSRKKYIIGNWKLHKNYNEISQFFKSFNKQITETANVVYGFAPTHACLDKAVRSKKKSSIKIVAQDVSSEVEGSFTGQISIKQLKDLKIEYAIVGHSETREFLGCCDECVGKKVDTLTNHNIKPIICIGEKASQKRNPQRALKAQLETIFRKIKPEQACQCLIAYEPIWAIGSGLTPTLRRINATAIFIRKTMKELFNGIVASKISILYGGSVSTENAKDILMLRNIDGLLIGGASLDATKIVKIIKVANVCERK